MFQALYGFPAAIARVLMVYGPAQHDITKLVPYVIDCMLRGEAPKISSGTRRIDWIYVDDVVRGFLQLAAADGVDGQSVDLGSGSTVTIRELVDQLCADGRRRGAALRRAAGSADRAAACREHHQIMAEDGLEAGGRPLGRSGAYDRVVPRAPRRERSRRRPSNSSMLYTGLICVYRLP